MKMIKVTRQGGAEPIWLNVDQIQAVRADAKMSCTHVWMAGDSDESGPWKVVETPEQVVEMINGTVSPAEPTA